MARIIWSRQFVRDLEAVCEYIAHDSPRYAPCFAARVVGRVERLAAHPRSGRQVPEQENPAIREIILGNYRIIYRYIEDEAAVVLLVLYHGARILDPDNLQ